MISQDQFAFDEETVIDSVIMGHKRLYEVKAAGEAICAKPERPCGNTILEIAGLGKEIQGVSVLNNLTLTVRKGDKNAFVGSDGLAKTTLFQILAGEMKPDKGSFRWGRRFPQPTFRRRAAPASGAT